MSPTAAARAAHSARTSLRRRLRVGLIAAGIALTVVLGGALWSLAVVRDRQEVVVEVYFEAITESDRASAALADAEAAVRGYALTGDPASLEGFDDLVAQGEESGQSGQGGQSDPQAGVDVTALLEEQFGSSDGVLTARARAAEAARRWYSEFALPVIDLVEAEGAGSVPPETIAAGQSLFDELQVVLAQYGAGLSAGRDAALEDLRRSVTVLTFALGILAVSAVAAGSGLWVFLRRWVTGPLAVLAADARTVAGGDLAHQVVDAGPGEVGDVARDVEQMRERLARLVADATAARAELEVANALLEEQTEDLRRSNRDLEQFAYVASHDLQEPLRKVASFTQLLAKRYEGQLDERADQYIGFAVDGAKRMQRLINDLLGFSRVGRVGGELSDVDLGAVAARVTDDLREAIDATGAVITAVDLPDVRGEEPLLHQLLTNLIANALKFRDPARPPQVRIDARPVGQQWEIACHDNGIGIDPQYAERVFVIFQRLHAKDVYEGTGIGLALCKKIVEYHGGDIWIDGTAEVGTTIRWTLPAAVPGTDGDEEHQDGDEDHQDETPAQRGRQDGAR
ncbi:HAMP domain-containing histidine kinase [Cellulomonas sp. KRMCY2]|uniref:HAMP domain-containing histidine kinase n=1 Tax=Cellulomonas sp. KRMCY2 TaxID=1304865 RepID=UPI00045E61AF|nr:HAMP domain-containing histidine kinase [Cellulomonas sp. KRMCY2]